MEQFSEMVKTCMEQRLGDGYHVSVHKVRKNNGLWLTALSIVEEGKEAAPAIYLDNYMEEYSSGSGI